jgi:hypothetical protein
MKAPLIAMAMLLCAGARAETTVAAQLADGERRYADLDYRGAASVCGEAAQDPRATKPEQARGWSCVGTSWLVLNQQRLAREAFDKLFALDPRYAVEDPSLSPRQRELIEDVRAKHPPPRIDEPKPEPAPKPEPPPPPPKTPVYKRWYLWTPIVIGAVGLGVGLGLGLTLGRQETPVGSLPPATVNLSLRF